MKGNESRRQAIFVDIEDSDGEDQVVKATVLHFDFFFPIISRVLTIESLRLA